VPSTNSLDRKALVDAIPSVGRPNLRSFSSNARGVRPAASPRSRVASAGLLVIEGMMSLSGT
jgi:hypothetical protein